MATMRTRTKPIDVVIDEFMTKVRIGTGCCTGIVL